MRLFAAVAVLCSTAVVAQTTDQAPPLPWEGFDAPALNAANGPTLGTDARTMGFLKVRAGVALHYERAPLRLMRVQEGADTQLVRVIANRVSAQVFGEFGVTDWLDIQLQMPFVPWQNGEDVSHYGLPALQAQGIGAPVVGLRAQLLTQAKYPLDLAVQLSGFFPVGTDLAHTGNQLGAMPQVHLGKDFGNLHLSGLAGVTLRKPITYGNLVQSHSFDAAATIGYGDWFRAELTARTTVPFSSFGPSAEALLGLRATRLKYADIFMAAGPAFGESPGTPTFRVLGGFAISNWEKPKPIDVCTLPTHTPDQCPLLDDDHDGVPNGRDLCPLVAEDKDLFQDDDGCPDPDNDLDGIPDTADKCPDVVGVEPYQGCPIPDTDGDTVLDTVDQCINEPGPVERMGCPIPDADGDTVPDEVDNCPKVKGPVNNQGCPEEKAQLVVITRAKLIIKEKVYFDTGKATIQKRSYPLLDQVASVLNAHPEISGIVIEGHTDNVGKAEMNRKLSQNRAVSVMAYLVKQGVSSDRLSAKGFGPDRPADTNDTAAGRELNRRVEFVISSEAAPAPAAPAAPSTTSPSKSE